MAEFSLQAMLKDSDVLTEISRVMQLSDIHAEHKDQTYDILLGKADEMPDPLCKSCDYNAVNIALKVFTRKYGHLVYDNSR